MALRGTLTHRKTRRLAMLLKIPVPAALGFMEALWHVTAENEMDGGIGRLTDADIAMEMFYEGDATALIEALVRRGCWIDRMAAGCTCMTGMSTATTPRTCGLAGRRSCTPTGPCRA